MLVYCNQIPKEDPDALDAAAILSIPISSVQEAEKVALRRLKVIVEILMVDWCTIPERYKAVPENISISLHDRAHVTPLRPQIHHLALRAMDRPLFVLE